MRVPAIEFAVLVGIVVVGAYLRLVDLNYAQLRWDDITLWNIARGFWIHPEVLGRGIPSSFGLANGPFQAYFLLPGTLISSFLDPAGAYATVALMNVVTIVLLWAFVRSYWGSRLGLLAALLFAVNPWAVIFSRRLWGNDMVAPLLVMVVWSLCDLARHGRRRDSVLPLLWSVVLVQVYVVALVHLIVAAVGLLFGWRRLRWPYFFVGLAVCALLVGPYFIKTVLPGMVALNELIGSADTPPVYDLESTRFAFHIVSVEGYQAFALNAGSIVDASSGFCQGISLATEAFMAVGVIAAVIEAGRRWRRGTLHEAVPYVLPLVAVFLPAALLVRHSKPVYPYYLLVGMPMHFIFVALGIRQVWRILNRLVRKLPRPANLLPTSLVGATVSLILATQLFLAPVFFAAIREYWAESNYGVPLQYTLDAASITRKLISHDGVSRVYLAGGEEPDDVLQDVLKNDVPSLARFDANTTFVAPDAKAGTSLYIVTSNSSRIGQEFATQLNDRLVSTLDVPGSGLRYSFYQVPTSQSAQLFRDPPGTNLGATFGGQVRLNSYHMEPDLRPGEAHTFMLRWSLLTGSGTLPDYMFYARLVDQSGNLYAGYNWGFCGAGRWEPGDTFTWWRSLSTPANLAPGVYWYRVGLYTVTSANTSQNASVIDANGQPAGDGVLVGPLVVRPQPPADPTHRLSASFGDNIALEGYDLDEAACVPGGSPTITLHWKALQTTDRNYTAFVQVLGPDGKIVAQNDAQPQAGRYPTSLWRPQESIADGHQLQLPSDLKSGHYTVAIGLYLLDTGERLGGQTFAATFPLTVSDSLP